MTNYLTVEQVLFLHSRLVEETGGAHGVRDLGLLESAVARPGATFGGEDLYADVFRKAAALMASLILNHPLVDGNKRTGIAAAALFLARNGCQLMVTNEKLETFVLEVAQSAPDTDETASWLKSHASASAIP